MPSHPESPIRRSRARAIAAAGFWRQRLATVLLVLGLLVALVASGGRAAEAASDAALPLQALYRCEGDLLQVRYQQGAVDAPDIPNRLAGTLPGAFLLLEWRGQRLQLPRTNNAGVPSYSDGRWWWRPLDPEHPEFRQRRGELVSYSCEPAA